MRRSFVVLVLAVVGGVLVWPLGFTVVPIDDGNAPSGAFDPVVYVDGIWDEVQTAVADDAVDLAEILTAIAPDENGRVQKDALIPVTEQYGLITPGEAHVYKVRISGVAASVDTESSVGIMQVQVDGFEGSVAVRVYLGPRIPSDDSSIRDAVGFIAFGDFRDQTEYGKVASELNSRVSSLLSTVDVGSLAGATVTVIGAMTIRTFNLVEIDLSEVHIVPLAVTPS